MRCGLLIYRPLHPTTPAARAPRSPGLEGTAPELCGSSPPGARERSVGLGSPRTGLSSQCRGPAHLAPPPPGSRAHGSRSGRGWHAQPPGAPPPRPKSQECPGNCSVAGGCPPPAPPTPGSAPPGPVLSRGAWSETVRMSTLHPSPGAPGGTGSPRLRCVSASFAPGLLVQPPRSNVLPALPFALHQSGTHQALLVFRASAVH